MWRDNMTMWIIPVFVSLAISVALGCPKDVMRGVTACMGPLEIYTMDQGGILELMSRPEKTSLLCTEGKIQVAFSCLNDLYNKCVQPWNSSRRLELIIDVGRWSKAMNKICSNIEYFRKNADCEKQASLEYKPCAEAEMSRVNRLLSDAWMRTSDSHPVSHDQRVDAVTKVGCHFSIKILHCLKIPFDKYCPTQLTNLVMETVKNFIPPTCARRDRTNSTDYHTYRSYEEIIDVTFGKPLTTNHQDRLPQPKEEKAAAAKIKIQDGKKEAIKSSRSAHGGTNEGRSRIKDGSWGVVAVLTLLVNFYRTW